MTTFETLQDILVAENNLNREALTPDAELTALGIDSLGFVDLLFQIEDRFGIQIPGDNPTDLHRLSDVVAYIDALRAKQAGAAPAERARAGS